MNKIKSYVCDQIKSCKIPIRPKTLATITTMFYLLFSTLPNKINAAYNESAIGIGVSTGASSYNTGGDLSQTFKPGISLRTIIRQNPRTKKDLYFGVAPGLYIGTDPKKPENYKSAITIGFEIPLSGIEFGVGFGGDAYDKDGKNVTSPFGRIYGAFPFGESFGIQTSLDIMSQEKELYFFPGVGFEYRF